MDIIKNRILRYSLYAFLALIAIGISYNFIFNKPLPKVNATQIKKQDVISTINTSGILSYENIVTIKSESSGRLKSADFKVGELVSSNAVLAMFENSDQQIAIRQAQNNLDSAYKSLESIKTDQLNSANEAIVQAQAEHQKTVNTYNSEAKLLQLNSQENDAQEKINSTKTTYEKKKSDYERVQKLFNANGATKNELENAKYDMDLALSQYNLAISAKESLVTDIAYKNAKTSMEQAESRLREAQNKKSTLLPGGSAYENALIKIREAQINVDNSKKNNNKTVLKSPFDGIVLSQIMQEGELANVGDKVLTLAKKEDLYIKASLDEKYASKILIGQKATVYPQGVNQTLNGSVRKILPSADSQRGIINIEISLTDYPTFLKNDMTVNVDIEINTYQNSIAVNKKYLSGEKGNKIAIVKDKTVKFIDIEISADLVDKVIIKSGLNEGDYIIDPKNFKDGDKVNLLTSKQ